MPRGFAVIWPANIDSEKSRKAGRKISSKDSVPSPTLREIERVARKMGLNPRVEKEKAYPRQWWEKGRVIVDKTKPKSILLKNIAKEIKKER
jgi:signal recognition particle subunit SRP19